MTKVKKQLLHDEPVPFKLLAISSSLSMSQMVWHINQKCQLSLGQNILLEALLGFPAFTDRGTYQTIVITLIGNKSQGKLLHPKLSNIDYLLELTGPADDTLVSKISTGIKSLPTTQTVIEVQPGLLKRKEPYCSE